MRPEKILFFSFVFFLIIAVPAIIAGDPQYEKWKILFTNEEGRRISLICDVADNMHKRGRGLMYVNHLENDKGMIFVYKSPGFYEFWMKNTKIPLSIAFVNENGYIISIREMQTGSEKKITSPQKFKYAIEANCGWFKNHFIKPGTPIEIIQSIN